MTALRRNTIQNTFCQKTANGINSTIVFDRVTQISWENVRLPNASPTWFSYSFTALVYAAPSFGLVMSSTGARSERRRMGVCCFCFELTIAMQSTKRPCWAVTLTTRTPSLDLTSSICPSWRKDPDGHRELRIARPQAPRFPRMPIISLDNFSTPAWTDSQIGNLECSSILYQSLFRIFGCAAVRCSTTWCPCNSYQASSLLTAADRSTPEGTVMKTSQSPTYHKFQFDIHTFCSSYFCTKAFTTWQSTTRQPAPEFSP
ncbi:hypothetical protein IWX91DRAFT_193487 [Phyllosticta citricarpa]